MAWTARGIARSGGREPRHHAKPGPGRLRPVSAGKIGISSNAPGSALRRDSVVTGEQMAGKPRRNDEPPRDAARTGSAGSHQPARRRYRRRVQLRPGPADQRAEHPGAFLTQGNQQGHPPAGERGFRRRLANPGRATLCYTAAPTARRGRHPSNGPAACSARRSWPVSRPESARTAAVRGRG
jgi:hypothetical protein